MADEFKISLQAVTGPAKDAFKRLARKKAQTRRSVNKAAAKRRPISQRFAFVAGFVGGLSAVSRITRTSAGNVDPWAEAMTPIMAVAQEITDKAFGFSAKARRRARGDAAERFGTSAHETKSTVAAQEHYARTVRIFEEEETGRNIIRQDPNFIGPGIGQLLAQVIPGYIRLIGKSARYIYDAIAG